MRKAQSSLEYIGILLCLVAALIAMQVYIKRGMQGRLKQVADDLGPQYAPKNSSYTQSVALYSKVTTEVNQDDAGNTTTTSTINEDDPERQTIITDSTRVGPLESKLFNDE